MHVAQATVFIAVATILYYFDISKAKDAKGAEIAPDIFAFTDGFNSRAEPFPCRIRPRSKWHEQTIVTQQAEAVEGLRESSPS